MKKNGQNQGRAVLPRISGYQGQMFDLDGTLTPSINVYKNPLYLPNYMRLKKGTLTLKPGAAELLQYLKGGDRKTALISNMTSELLGEYIHCDGINKDAPLRDAFDPILITGAGAGRSPYVEKSELMQSTLEYWKMKNDQAIYYGDTLRDAVAAHDAKVKFCLVGNPKEKDLREIQKISQLQINDFTDLGF